MPNARPTKSEDWDKASIFSEALAFEASEDLLPEVADIISSALEYLGPRIASGEIRLDASALRLAPVLGVLAGKLGGGRLKALAPRILAGTQIQITHDDGTKTKHDLVKKSDRDECFDYRPDLYVMALFFAGRLTFGRFFPAGLRALFTRRPPETSK